MSQRPIGRETQKLVRQRLLEIYGLLGTWGKVERETGLNRGQCWEVANGRDRATRRMAEKLGIQPVVKRRMPWKKKYQLLRKFVTQRRAP
jgi:hypothetical protein